jgi:citrate lyase subunit beta/citryl-CoA lyase
MVLRSLLFVPATRPDRFQKALDSGADAVIFDLEDAVEAGRKAEARAELGRFLTSAPHSPAATFVRINATESAWYDDDLGWLPGVIARVDAVVVPKAERAADLERAASASGSADRAIIPMLETARGILHAPEILSARATIPAAIFGAEDLTAELGIPRTLAGEELLYARSRVVLAAATIGAAPIDAVWVRLTDAAGLREDATRARALGFRGKTAIQPDQVALINDVFSPTPDEVTRARLIVDADDRARAAGDGAYRLNDEMVDAPVVKRARHVLAMVERLRK